MQGCMCRCGRELKAKAGAPGAELPICEGHALSLADGAVVLAGVGTSEFFERAEEVEDYKVRLAAQRRRPAVPHGTVLAPGDAHRGLSNGTSVPTQVGNAAVQVDSGLGLRFERWVQGGDGELEDGYDEGVRHAETPELAREALADCAVLIFKGQVRALVYGHLRLL